MHGQLVVVDLESTHSVGVHDYVVFFMPRARNRQARERFAPWSAQVVQRNRRLPMGGLP